MQELVGASLVSQHGIILGIGYRGFPRGCSDDSLPWAKKSNTGNPLETKYPEEVKNSDVTYIASHKLTFIGWGKSKETSAGDE
ncbi:hypothetical protein L6164_010942 [Bauhinia variegata]|uniref:Uncharacterized protein n=1 Tax=Bauhinia variegata TaxID=167791 RepID=A0ACB9P6P1_BAUVA|nr:hypothetical protein L6164_010942 [Bauhinia variegata]